MIPLRFSSPPEKPALQIIATAIAVNRKTQVENANRRINLRASARFFAREIISLCGGISG
jgi:hypothetical protein